MSKLLEWVCTDLIRGGTFEINEIKKKWAKDLGRHFPKDIHTDYKQMKGYTSSIIIWGTKLKPYWYTTTSHSVGWLLSKHTHTQKISQKISIGKDVEKLESLCTVFGNVELCIHYRKHHGGSSKY